MSWDLIKKNILKEIKTVINTIDPAFDVDHCLNLYAKILKFKITVPTKNNLDGLEKSIYDTLEENFLRGQTNDTSVGIFCKNFEQFVKKIYYILEEGECIDREYIIDHSKLLAITPYLTVFNKIRPLYLDANGKFVDELELAKFVDGSPIYKLNKDSGQQAFKRLYPNSLNFDTYISVDDIILNHKYQNDFLLYFIKAIILKNEQSHQVPERTRVQNVNNLNNTLIAELWIINFFKKEIANSIKKENYKNRDLDDYILSEKMRLKNNSSKFVSLNLKEMKNQIEIGKSGFIEDLIDYKITRMRILGQGGSGKTTTLEHLFSKDAEKWLEGSASNRLPVLISLGNLSSHETVLESISKKTHASIDYVEELLNNNEIILYLDGVNEIVENRESKKLKLQEISSLISEYPKLNLIITDRFEFDSYQSNMFDVPTFLIQKLDTNQIEEFVIKYCNNSKELSDHVLSVLNSKTNIRDILLKPLVLTRAIEIIKTENNLPEKEGQIIEKFLDTLLVREKDEKKDPLLNVNNFKLLLAYAANEIWQKYKSNAPIHEFKFNKLLIDGAEKFGLEKSNAGYISRIGYELEILSKNDDIIQFYHHSYIEFFCKHYAKYEYR